MNTALSSSAFAAPALPPPSTSPQHLLELLLAERRQRQLSCAALERRLRDLELRLDPPAAGGGFKKLEPLETFRCAPESDCDEDGASASESTDLLTTASFFDTEKVTRANLDDQAAYKLAPSIWDCCLFLGLDCVGAGASLMVVALTVVSAFTQAYFFHVVCKFMIDDPVSGDVLASLLEFRTTFAHNIQYSDWQKPLSLASVVCQVEDNFASPLAGRQTTLYQDLTDASNGGHHLVILALFCWILTIVGELDDTLQYARAVLNLPRGDKTRIVLRGDGDGLQAEVLSITARRSRSLVACVAAPRALIAFGLFWAGSRFLTVTLDPSELLLNAMALGFVLDIDNLIFSVLAPRRISSLLVRVNSLPVRDAEERQLCNHTVGKVFCVVLLLSFAWIDQVVGVYSRVAQAKHILCSGNLNFVQAANPASGIVQLGVTDRERNGDLTSLQKSALQMANATFLEQTQGWELPAVWQEALSAPVRESHVLLGWSDLKERIVQFHRDRLGNKSARRGMVEGLGNLKPDETVLNTLQTLAVATVHDGADLLDCRDAGAAWNVVGLRHLVPNASSCSEISHLCTNETAARGVCPITCGCHDYPEPKAGFFAAPAFGCPSVCQRSLHAVMVARKQANSQEPCLDTPPAEFATDPYVRMYLEQSFEHLTHRIGTFISLKATIRLMPYVLKIPENRKDDVLWGIMNGTIVRDMVEKGRYQLTEGVPHPRQLTGCAFWTSWEVSLLITADLCNVGGFRSLRAQCPLSCGCGPGMEECPLACVAPSLASERLL